MESNKFSIKNDGSIFLDDTKLLNVKEYKLHSSAGSPTELTLIMDVKAGPFAFESHRDYPELPPVITAD